MHRVGRALVAATTVAFLIQGGSASGEGGGTAGVNGDQGGIDLGAGSTGRSRGGGGSGGSGKVTCTYTPLNVGSDVTVYESDGTPIVPTGGGSWYEKICVDAAGGRTFSAGMFIPERKPADLAAEAKRFLPLPAPRISTSPSTSEVQIVSFPTWLWIDPAAWRPLSSSVSVPGITVTATAVPERVVWDMGDGTRVTCGGPGTAYNPAIPDEQQSTDCSHVYRRTSARESGQAFRVTATIQWRATWTVAGAGGGGDLGIVPRRSAPVPLRVGEVQAVNTQSTREG